MPTLNFYVAILLLISAILGSMIPASSFERDWRNDTSLRLPQNLVPLYYKLDFIPLLEKKGKANINGKVWIDVNCTQRTKIITLHGVKLNVKKQTVKVIPIQKSELPVQTQTKEKKSTKYVVTGVEYQKHLEFINISVKSRLKVGRLYRISMEYTGKIRNDSVGFYKSDYFDKEKNATRYVGVTNFQPSDARVAFPCFDEPQLKAKFEISLGRRTDMGSLANTELRKTEPMQGKEGWVWDHYQKSNVMSSYMVAFAVSEFESNVATNSDEHFQFRVWARKDSMSQTEFANTVGPKLMTFYEDYFGIKYPMQKMDMIAVPDMEGAMGNWGLVTSAETYMLYNPNVTNDRTKMNVALTIGNKLATQWTGNLVTMKWWSEVWLNFGFAQYMQYIGLDHVFPEWNIFQYFMRDEMQYVFRRDSLSSSYPVVFEFEYASEIDKNVGITYSKGASILRMMSHFLTESTFKNGLRQYLKKWVYNSTQQNDLWDSLTKQAHEDGTLVDTMTVHEIMETWTLQNGYPVITAVRNYIDGSVTFTQTKFVLYDSLNSSQLEKYKWWVPISVATLNSNENFLQTTPTIWLRNDTASSTHQLHVDNSSWFIANAQQTGYYRVNYDTKNWDLIISQLMSSHAAIHVFNRAQLIDDAFNLARSGELSYKIGFRLTKYITSEFEPLPWNTMLTAFSYIGYMLSNSTAHTTFNRYVRTLLKTQLDHVGYTDKSLDSHQTKLHRMKIVGWACYVGVPGCFDHVTELFAQWMNQSNPDDCNPISKNLRSIVYTVAIYSGGEAEWDFLWERYLQSDVASEQEIILAALGHSEDPLILNQYLNWTTSAGHGIRKRNVDAVFSAVASHPIGNSLAFKFIQANYYEMMKYLKSYGWVNSLMTTVASRFKTEEQLEAFNIFVENHGYTLEDSSNIIKRTVESISAKVVWIEDNFDEINQWLAENVKV